MRVLLLTVPLVLAALGCGSGSPDAAAVSKQMTSEQLAVGEPVVNGVGMVMVPIPAGEFQMGTVEDKSKKKDDHTRFMLAPERPQHLVKITKPFFMSSCEVTQQQFEEVTGKTPWQGKPLVKEKPTSAASYVTWEDADEFCRKLSEKEDETYRLPTEAEWEYACRAGSKTAWSFGDDGGGLGDHAWYDANAYHDGQQYAHRVGTKKPNTWGLYDMHGNVWEWCQDWHGPYDGKKKELVDPTGPPKGRHHVWRGGGFADPPHNARSATRLNSGREAYHADFMCGFRVAREIEAGE